MAIIRVTITGAYEAEPSNYASGSGLNMAEQDLNEYHSGGVSLQDVLEWLDDVQVTMKQED